VTDDLYDLVGGKRTIWAVTESFYKKVLAHEVFIGRGMLHLPLRQL
jgi:truncated hemoglobin YjbI